VGAAVRQGGRQQGCRVMLCIALTSKPHQTFEMSTAFGWRGSWEPSRESLRHHVDKWRGDPKSGPGKHELLAYVPIAWLGAFLSIGFISCLGYLQPSNLLTPIGSMGAQAVLVFAAPKAPFSQPRNAVGGQIIAAVVATICRMHIAVPMGTKVLALPLSVAFTLVFQFAFRCVNPPAGGTAALLVISDPAIDALGWAVLCPVVVESCIMVLVAGLVINSLTSESYPKQFVPTRDGERNG